MIRVRLDDRALRRKVKKMMESLSPGGRRRVMRRIGAGLRDRVRRRFTTSGNGTWAPLSRWTQARTGRFKPLLPLRRRIKSRLNAGKAEVYFEPPSSEWNIDMHHKGFVSPPVEDKRMVVPLRAGSRIGVRRRSIVFTRRNPSVIPARRIWLNARETQKAVNEELQVLVEEFERA